MRTIQVIRKLLRKGDNVIVTEFISAITGGIIITENERKLLSFVTRLEGLGIPIFEELCKIEYQKYIVISEHLCHRITNQFRKHKPNPELNSKKKQIKSVDFK